MLDICLFSSIEVNALKYGHIKNYYLNLKKIWSPQFLESHVVFRIFCGLTHEAVSNYLNSASDKTIIELWNVRGCKLPDLCTYPCNAWGNLGKPYNLSG
jgi:hypothetical protein